MIPRRLSTRPRTPLLDVAPDASDVFRVDGRVNLRETLGQARLGPFDPTFKLIESGAWRASRTPVGVATERLRVQADGRVLVEAWGPGAQWLVDRAPALCGAADAPERFTCTSAFVQRLAKRHRGLRMGRTAAVYEAAIGITVEQRVATPDAWESWRGLVFALGERAPGPMPWLRLPPAPERLALAPLHVLHRFGIEERRGAILRRLAIVARRLEETQNLALDEAYRRLRAIPGVGPWTAARIGLIALGDPDAVILGDLHLPHLVTSLLAGEPRGSDERMLELLEPFRGQRGRVIRLLMAARFSANRR